MHLVHLTESFQLNVLGFLFQLSKTDNPRLEPILHSINKTFYESSSKLDLLTDKNKFFNLF